MDDAIIRPDWPAPARVRAATTTRRGGASRGPWAGFNLGDHVGDDPAHVAANRRALMDELGLRVSPFRLEQVHSARCVNLDTAPEGPLLTGDAALSHRPGVPCAVLTADCLPVLLCDRAGTTVAACHAGWRGLAGGVLRNTVRAMAVTPQALLAYLAPAIGPDHFQVGGEVREAFLASALGEAHRARIRAAFAPDAEGRYRGDLHALARAELAALGTEAVYGGGRCTFSEEGDFYSYRRDGTTGRMASLIWLEE